MADQSLQHFIFPVTLINIWRIFIVHTAVVIINFLADKRIIYFYQSINDAEFFPLRHLFNQSFIYLSYVPMGWDCIPALSDIIKRPIYDFCILYEVITYSVNIITVVNIRQIIYFLQSFFTQLINNVCSGIFCFSGNIVNQTACKKRSFSFLSSRPVIFL